ncbi:hypothetical protein RvY_01795 [Ramazzottius varieornatus]|uniref:LRRCT domain-containing protein n=1 Tax=Ramazzottius varieornatus TaxID=947166 RepID=A0A1D1USR1_RAMVA|nr:hypothetical protein RvY_01795 [Ramazzottius varieornatus]
MLLLYALLLMFFAGTEQACPLKCSCQLEAVIDCRDMALTSLGGKDGVIDGSIRTILASDNSIRHVNVSLLLMSHPKLKLLVLTNNADLECPSQQPEVAIVGCLYSSTNVAQTTTAAPTTRSTTSIKTNAIIPYINESGVDNVSQASEAPQDPTWKVAVYVAVGVVASVIVVAAFVGVVYFACRKFRKDQALELHSSRSLVNPNAVYASRIGETDSIESE